MNAASHSLEKLSHRSELIHPFTSVERSFDYQGNATWVTIREKRAAFPWLPVVESTLTDRVDHAGHAVNFEGKREAVSTDYLPSEAVKGSKIESSPNECHTISP